MCFFGFCCKGYDQRRREAAIKCVSMSLRIDKAKRYGITMDRLTQLEHEYKLDGLTIERFYLNGGNLQDDSIFQVFLEPS
jgi:hypothetical protein